MNASVSVKLDLSGSQQQRATIKARVAQVVAVAAHRIEARQKMLVPVDTGATKNSIAVTFEDGGLVARIGPSTEYSIYIEAGTRHMPARPFVIPALEAEADAFKAAVKHVVESG